MCADGIYRILAFLFAQGLWYDLENGLHVATGPVSLSVDAPLDKIPVYVRSGKILPFQEPSVTTDERYIVYILVSFF